MKTPFHGDVHKAFIAHREAEHRRRAEDDSDDRRRKGQLSGAVTRKRSTLMRKIKQHHNPKNSQERISILTKLQNHHDGDYKQPPRNDYYSMHEEHGAGEERHIVNIAMKYRNLQVHFKKEKHGNPNIKGHQYSTTAYEVDHNGRRVGLNHHGSYNKLYDNEKQWKSAHDRLKKKHAKLNEEHGAGEEGTDKLRKKYQKETPGQEVTEISRDMKQRYLDKAVPDHYDRFTKPARPDQLTPKGRVKKSVRNSPEVKRGRNTLNKRYKYIQKVSKELKGKTNFREETEGAAPTVNTGAIPEPGALKLKKTGLFKTTQVTDKRKNPKNGIRILKRFREFVER